MNNQLSTSKEADYNSNQAIIKSQKILNSVSNFHVKTEQPQRHNEHLRSPENQKNDLRDTWRRPRMPYNKLPDAFQIKQKKKKTNREVIDNLDRIVKYNEYKEIQKYLEPISLLSVQLGKERKAEERARDFMDNGNPLATYQKYLKIKTKFSEQLQDKDISTNKYKAFSTKQAVQSIRVTDCITLQLLKRGHNTGTVKKMLHVPSLRLLSVREEPLNSKQTRNSIKQWLVFWQGRLGGEQNKRFAAVYAAAYNYPQGAVSIVSEYFKYGSLLDLLQVVITLPERVIQEMFSELLQNLGQFYELSEMQFGGLSPSQVMITQNGRIKLGMGLFYHLPPNTSSSIYSIRPSKLVSLEFNTTHKNFMKTTLQRSTNPELQKSLDIFKIGLMMLECAIGGFDNFQQSAFLKDSIKNIFTEDGQRVIEHQNVCCLIHSQIYLLENAGQQDQRSRRDRLQISKVLLYMKFLKDRFSLPFINLLCICLKLHHSKRATFRELIQHSFLRNQASKDAKSVNVSLLDLIQVSSECNQEYTGSMQKERVDKIIGHVLHVFNDCRREQLIQLLQNDKDKILNLGKLIGLNEEGLGQRLYEAMEEMARVEKADFSTSI